MHSKTNYKDSLLVFGKGILMGAADVVPGVSGGTIAFITGIYAELIASLSNISNQAVKIFFQQGFRAAWRYVNGNFLLLLLSGILLSIASFAHLILYALEFYPTLLWAFFFGLILASSWHLAGQISGWHTQRVLLFLFGASVAFIITSLPPMALAPSPLVFFLAGAIAICAMLLPGVSGSFILLLLGLYGPVLLAIKNVDVLLLGLFVLGCVLGLLTFSRALHWLFEQHQQNTLALLGGFLLGSLNKVWPWKYTLIYTLDKGANAVPLVQQNILPNSYLSLTGQEAMFVPALIMMALGVLLVLALSYKSKSRVD